MFLTVNYIGAACCFKNFFRNKSFSNDLEYLNKFVGNTNNLTFESNCLNEIVELRV